MGSIFFKKMTLNRLVVLLSFICQNGIAQVKLPAIISDNMVLQQNQKVSIWGKARPGEKLSVNILKQNKETIVDKDGNWQVWLDPMKSSRAVTMTVSGLDTIIVKNILVGEVWFAAGQSNMEWNVSQSNNANQEISSANYPEIRIFDAQRSFSDKIKEDIAGKWVVCSPETIKNITAAGYFFSRGIHNKLKVPIGLIDAAWGATRCEAWTPVAAIKADPRLAYWTTKWANYVREFPALEEAYKVKRAVWEKERKIAEIAGTRIPDEPRKPMLKTKVEPSVIYNGVVAPIANYTIRGVIWYQGENNAYKEEAYSYRYLFPTMIKAWRDAWGQGDFPFIFVQLSTLEKHPYWPVLRESQTEALQLPNTGMVVTYDIGDSKDAHYKNKQDVGKRLELVARKLVYGEKINASGPMFRKMKVEGNSIRILFDYSKGLKAAGSSELKGFEIGSKDGKLFSAVAKIEGETIVLSHPEVTQPSIVRYAFKDVTNANLINDDALPAVPFRTDVKEGF